MGCTASASVTTPFGPNTEDAGAIYRVIVKMIWHRRDDSIQGTARHRVNCYRSVLDPGGSGRQGNVCSDYWSPNFSGFFAWLRLGRRRPVR